MKLVNAKELGKACGLETDGEAVLNVVIHASQIFEYDEIEQELQELEIDYDAVHGKCSYAELLSNFNERFQ